MRIERILECSHCSQLACLLLRLHQFRLRLPDSVLGAKCSVQFPNLRQNKLLQLGKRQIRLFIVLGGSDRKVQISVAQMTNNQRLKAETLGLRRYRFDK